MRLICGKDYKHLSKGGIPVYGSGGYMLSVDDYLYEGESACIGRKGTIDKPMFLSGRFWTVDTLFYTHSFQDCLPKFIYLIFQNVAWVKHNEAGGVPSLSKTIINQLKAYVPSLPEQQKVAATLSSLDDLLTAQGAKLAALQAHKRGLMQGLFPAEGETVPKLRFPEFQDAAEWEEMTLGEIVKFSSGGTPSKNKPEYWNGDTPWISASSMHGYVIDKSELYITDAARTAGAAIAGKGVLLLLVRGSMLFKRIPMGITAREVAFNQDVKALQVAKGIDPLYLMYCLVSNEGVLLSTVTATGIGAGKLDTTDLMQFPICIPPPAEQQKIIDCLTALDNRITAQNQKIEALQLHKKGLMQGLFPAAAEHTA